MITHLDIPEIEMKGAVTERGSIHPNVFFRLLVKAIEQNLAFIKRGLPEEDMEDMFWYVAEKYGYGMDAINETIKRYIKKENDWDSHYHFFLNVVEENKKLDEANLRAMGL